MHFTTAESNFRAKDDFGETVASVLSSILYLHYAPPRNR